MPTTPGGLWAEHMDSIRSRETNRGIGQVGSVGLDAECGDTEDEPMSMSREEMRQETEPNKQMKEQTNSKIGPGINTVNNRVRGANRWKSIAIRFTEEINIGEEEELREGEPKNNLIPKRARPTKSLIRQKESKKRPQKSKRIQMRLLEMWIMPIDQIEKQSEKYIEFHKNYREKNES